MKTRHLLFLLATIVMASCSQPQTPTGPKDDLGYYIYNPEDTIDNQPFYDLLWIDSARVEFWLDHPVSEIPLINLDSTKGSKKTPEQLQQENSIVVFESEAKWFELMRLCKQRQYEEALSLYIKEQTEIGIALATSTNKFDLDYFVIGPLLFEQLEEEEAVENMVKFLEYDKFLTESVILLGESKQGYVPPQYAFQIKVLCDMYLMQDDREKTEALIEPYRKAVYLLSEDTLQNEYEMLFFKYPIYRHFIDLEKIIEANEELRVFLKQYAKDTNQDFDEEIEAMGEYVNSLKMKLKKANQ